MAEDTTSAVWDQKSKDLIKLAQEPEMSFNEFARTELSEFGKLAAPVKQKEISEFLVCFVESDLVLHGALTVILMYESIYSY